MNIAIIPARGGSRRIPRKNVKPFLGKPILAYSIETAIGSGLFTEVWVSTDDMEIARVAFQNGAQVHPRQKELAEDGVGTQEVVRNALLELFDAEERPEFTCCIYPCAPTLWPKDLCAALEGLQARPERNYVKVDGMFYFGKTQNFLNDVPTHGPNICEMEPCYRWVDIDVAADWLEAERIYYRMKQAWTC